MIRILPQASMLDTELTSQAVIDQLVPLMPNAKKTKLNKKVAFGVQMFRNNNRMPRQVAWVRSCGASVKAFNFTDDAHGLWLWVLFEDHQRTKEQARHSLIFG